MPILQNAKKALRSSRRKAVFNSRIRSILKTTMDKMKQNPSAANLAEAFSSIDKSVKRNLMHRNKAARLKSQLSKLVKAGDAPKAKKKAVVKKTTAKKAPAKKTAKKVAVKKAATKKAPAKKTKASASKK